MTREEEIKYASKDYVNCLLDKQEYHNENYTEDDIRQAFEKGAKWADNHSINVWHDTDFYQSPDVYRIKPEPKYRPFKTQEECWSEMLKHQPFGWVIGGKDYENFYHIEYVYSCNPYNYHRVKLSQNDMSFNYEHMFRDFTFIDGSPFGIKDE